MSAAVVYPRPTTRGGVRDHLSAGEACEVVTHNASITSMLIRGWLGCKDFTVTPSENKGWSVFRPNKPGDKENEDSHDSGARTVVCS